MKDIMLKNITLSQEPEPQELNIIDVVLNITLLLKTAKLKPIASILAIFCRFSINTPFI